jgi:plasmid stabilization system protein ParE
MSTPIRWTSKALGDLARLHGFLAEVNPRAAAEVVKALTKGVGVLSDNPRLGTALGGFEPREVRRILIRQYELRYEISQGAVIVLRLWHTREDR